MCVVNVAHSAQAVELDLSQFAGRIPIELNAGSVFPPIGELTYLLTLPPYGFYWFALATQKDQPTWHTPAPEPLPEFVTMVTRDPLAGALVTPAAKLIEDGTYDSFLAERYAGWEKPAAKEMLAGKASLEDIASRVARERADPKPKSGRQEYLENLLNRFV